MTKVLVVEDSPLNTDLVVEMLNTVGFKAETAADGEEAVRKAKNDVYDLVIMDIELPCMDGIEAAKIIRTIPGYEKTDIIALTAYAMKGDRERFLAEGFDEYVSKPVNVDDFMELLKKYRR